MAEKVEKERLDVLLVQLGLANSRELAKAYIMAGNVYVDGQKEDKAGAQFDESKIQLEVKGTQLKYVSRGGLKLEKAMERAAVWGIDTAYGSHEQLLRDPNVNVVYISTVNSAHYSWAKAAIMAGKHVLCEKPCTIHSEQTKELFDLAQEKGVFFMEAQKMLFLPAILALRESVESGELGQIYMAQLNHSFSAGYNNWLFDPAAGGGPLLSSGIYAVELLLWLFGQIKTIKGNRCAMENGVEWQYVLSGTTESGVLFNAKNSTRAILDNTARIFGTKGYVEIPEYWKARKAIFHIAGQKPETAEFPCEHELMYEAAHIAACMEQGLLRSPVVTEEISVGGISALEAVKNNW